MISGLVKKPSQQKPVVWMYQDKSTNEVRFQKHMRDFVDHGQTYETPLYANEWVEEPLDKIMPIPQPEPEPVADKYLMEVECTKCGAKQDGVLTVTAPSQRKEWQGLTEEEAEQIVDAHWNDPSMFIEAIETKLKEKNS